MKMFALILVIVALLVGGAWAGAAERPVPRPLTSALQDVARTVRPVWRDPMPVVNVAAQGSFDDWIAAFRDRALSEGLSAATLDTALTGLRYDADVVKRDRNQNEFTKTIWDYLDTAVSDARIRNGKAAMARVADGLARIEAEYGVDKHILAAIWGLESAYGGFKGSNSVIRSLASLAYDTRRSAFFEAQLLAALQIIEAGDVKASNMTGSWAGAMGHTQFMPSSYLDHAVDFTGDGKRDIWDEEPLDALASAANYLSAFGWVSGQPWGTEVRLPEGFDYRLADREVLKAPSDWAALGVLGRDGQAVPDYGPSSVLLPAGAEGAAFMIFDNFEVLERYNTADAYVIGVGHLADRLGGGGPIEAPWPREDRALSYDERVELQERLTAGGFDTVKIDGKIGPLTINAVRAYQEAEGLVPDGYASLRILERLR